MTDMRPSVTADGASRGASLLSGLSNRSGMALVGQLYG